MCTYMVRTYICPLINTPTPEGVIISQPIFRFLGVIFDGDHDFEGPRSPIAHLDTVLRKRHLGTPFTLYHGCGMGITDQLFSAPPRPGPRVHTSLFTQTHELKSHPTPFKGKTSAKG